jgi:uncharacterized protein involved in outer membrane biogenesis
VRRVLVVAGALLLATAAGLVALALLAASQGQRLLAAASAALGRDVTAEDVGISLGLGVGVALEGLRVAADPALGRDAEPLLTAERAEMRVRILPLLRRQVVVEQVLLDAPAVTIVRDRTGRLNVGRFGAPAAARPPERREPPAPAAKGPGAPAPADAPARPAFQIATLRMRDGVLRYRDDVTGRTTELLDLAADGRQPRLDAPMPVSFRARLVSPDVAFEALGGTGVLDLAAEPVAYRGTVEGGPGRVGELPIARLEATLEARPPVLVVEESRVDLLDGHATASARVGAPGRWLVARLAAEGLDLERLPREAGKPHPGGRLDLSGELTGPSPANAAFRLALAGTGRFAVREGRVAGLAVGRALRDVLQAVLREEKARRLAERYPELFGGDELRFTKLEGSGRLAQGRIRTDDLVVAAPSYEMRGEGTMALDGTLDVVVRLLASPALTEDLVGDEKIRRVVAGADGRLTVPLRVTGDVRRPRVVPDARFAATLAAGALGSQDLGEAASGLLERLLRPRERKRKGR